MEPSLHHEGSLTGKRHFPGPQHYLSISLNRFLSTHFIPEDGDSMLLRNVAIRLQDYKISEAPRLQSEEPEMREAENPYPQSLFF